MTTIKVLDKTFQNIKFIWRCK